MNTVSDFVHLVQDLRAEYKVPNMPGSDWGTGCRR